MVEIELSAPGANHIKRAVLKASVLTSLSESEPGVYVNGSTKDQTITLNPGDSMYVPIGTISIWLFCKTDSQSYSASLKLEEVGD